MRAALAVFLLAAALLAQGPVDPPPDHKRLKPLPPGQVRVLQAIVIEVQGVAQARPRKKKGAKQRPKWRKLRKNDALSPGVVVRTGRKSTVVLRVGANATLIIDRQSRVAIPEIVQNGKLLKTRVKLGFGRADVKVDRIGLDNDFEVATPTATLAVRGTAMRIWWDADGYRAIGVSSNRIHAILTRYLDGVKAYLSKDDQAGETGKLPAVEGYYEVYLWPILGEISPGEYPQDGQDQDARPQRSQRDSGRAASSKLRSLAGIDKPTGRGPPTENPGPPTTISPG